MNDQEIMIKKAKVFSWVTQPETCIYQPNKQDVTQGQFLSDILLVWIQSFSFPSLTALPKAK